MLVNDISLFHHMHRQSICFCSILEKEKNAFGYMHQMLGTQYLSHCSVVVVVVICIIPLFFILPCDLFSSILFSLSLSVSVFSFFTACSFSVSSVFPYSISLYLFRFSSKTTISLRVVYTSVRRHASHKKLHQRIGLTRSDYKEPLRNEANKQIRDVNKIVCILYSVCSMWHMVVMLMLDIINQVHIKQRMSNRNCSFINNINKLRTVGI